MILWIGGQKVKNINKYEKIITCVAPATSDGIDVIIVGKNLVISIFCYIFAFPTDQ